MSVDRKERRAELLQRVQRWRDRALGATSFGTYSAIVMAAHRVVDDRREHAHAANLPRLTSLDEVRLGVRAACVNLAAHLDAQPVPPYAPSDEWAAGWSAAVATSVAGLRCPSAYCDGCTVCATATAPHRPTGEPLRSML
jgi:hypothetical protein